MFDKVNGENQPAPQDETFVEARTALSEPVAAQENIPAESDVADVDLELISQSESETAEKPADEQTETSQNEEKKEKKKINFREVYKWVYKLRAVIMAVPVLIAAVILAIQNLTKLPEKLNIYYPTYVDQRIVAEITQISREAAVYGSLLITVVCLVLMFGSKRTIYPWLISIFTLALPLFFRLICVY